jgi:hypothetical protein
LSRGVEEKGDVAERRLQLALRQYKVTAVFYLKKGHNAFESDMKNCRFLQENHNYLLEKKPY